MAFLSGRQRLLGFSFVVAIVRFLTYHACIAVAGGAASGGGAVLELTDDTFDAALQDHPLLLVKFYAPWCGHCQKLAPEYEKAAEVFRARDNSTGGVTTFAQVDATAQEQLAERYLIEGYPTLYLFRHGRREEYSGGRDSAGIVRWVEEHSGPALKQLATDASLDAALRKRTVLPYFVMRGVSTSAGLRAAFGELAEKRNSLGSWFVMDTLTADEIPRIQVYRGVSEVVDLPLQADANMDANGLLELIKPELLPAFGEIGEENFEPYLEQASLRGKKGGVLWVCFDAKTFKEDAVRHDGTFQQVAAAFPKTSVVYLDTNLYQEHVKEELGCEIFPSIVLQIGNFSSREEELTTYKLVLGATPDPSEGNEVEDDATGAAASAPVNITSEIVISWVQAALDGNVEPEDFTDSLDDDADEEIEEDGDAETAEATGTAETQSGSDVSSPPGAAQAADESRQTDEAPGGGVGQDAEGEGTNPGGERSDGDGVVASSATPGAGATPPHRANEEL